jgi:hypothetical protein
VAVATIKSVKNVIFADTMNKLKVRTERRRVMFLKSIIIPHQLNP